MKIALVYPYLNKQGGVERYVWELIKALMHKHEVTLFANEWDASAEGAFEIIKVPMMTIPRFLASPTFSLFSFLKIKKYAFDIVHVQGANGFRQDVITAHSCHKAWFFHSLKETISRPGRRLLTVLNPAHYLTVLIETLQYRKGGYKKIIAISNAVKNELISHYGVPGSDIEVIYNGTNCQEFHPGNRRLYAGEVKKRHRITHETVLLFVANEFKRKGLEYVLKAVALLKHEHIKLMVIGKDRAKGYKDLCDSLGISDTVIFTGPSEDIKKYYAAGDIFILPTTYEPFGLVITEAMASGMPVIVGKQAGAAELVRNAETGLLINDCRDPEEIAGLVRQLLDAGKRLKMGQSAREKAEELSWDTAAGKTIKVYEDVLKEENKYSQLPVKV